MQQQAEEKKKPPVARKGDQQSEADKAPSALEAPKKKIHAWTFTLPAKVRDPDRDPKKVTLRELDADDMGRADKLAGNDPRRSADEAVKLSLYKVDGRLVDHGEAEADFFWGRFSARVRAQLQLAWAKLHTTDEKEDEDFLSSMTAD